jgi:hypothetical protein
MIYRVLGAWLVGKDPSGKDVKLLLQEEMGHRTEVFNLDDIGAYLAEHHPDLYKDSGTDMFDFNSFSPEILNACLAHARALRQRRPGQTIHKGYIVDLPFSYPTRAEWARSCGKKQS